jgi:hypothetical protein
VGKRGGLPRAAASDVLLNLGNPPDDPSCLSDLEFSLVLSTDFLPLRLARKDMP